MNIRFSVICALMFASVCAWAEGTRTWEQSKYEEFAKGTAKGVAIRSDGTLELAPTFQPVTTTPSTYIWAIAPGLQGDIFVAAGAPARVYRITPDGKSAVIFEPQELQVQSLVVDPKGVVYAATSPDGQVYKLEHSEKTAARSATKETAQGNAADAGWKSSELFDPKTKYIWQLALDKEGRLYVATGDHGEIFRVERNGQGSLFFKSDEAHIRALAFDPEGNVIAGSDGSGLVYRISPQGEAFVLYSAPKKEITALAVDDAGNIFAAGVGEKRSATGSSSMSMPIAPMSSTGSSTGITMQALPQTGSASSASAAPPVSMMPSFPPPSTGTAGSEVYQIAPDGSPRRIWSSRDEVVYALGFGPHGRLLAGTGNKGRVFAIEGEQRFTDLLKASATQVTGFAKAPGGGLYVSTSNLGKIFRLGGSVADEGTYQSDVFDARIFSRWGRAQVRGAGPYELWARSGNVDNPDRNWSPWKQVDLDRDAELSVPPARFVQWKAVLKSGDSAPTIDSVLLYYLSKNVAPVIDDVTVQVGGRADTPPKTESAGSNNIPPMLPLLSRSEAPSTPPRGSVRVRWIAHDDNDDELVYTVYYRGDNETRWKLLKEHLSEKSYTFDSGMLPDGGYTIKVVATDAPSHSPDETLSDSHESARFEVDTTPPRIDDLNGAVESDGVRVTFRATDGFSVIKRAEYSIDAGEWQFVEPVGQLSDARSENYDFAVRLSAKAETIPAPDAAATSRPSVKPGARTKSGKKTADDDPPPAAFTGSEHLVVVRVWDRFDNVATAKVVLHSK